MIYDNMVVAVADTPTPEPEPQAADLFISEAAEGSSNNKYMEFANFTGADVSLDGYAFPNTNNGADTTGTHDYWNAFPSGAVVAAGDVYVICDSDLDASVAGECDANHEYFSNGDDGYALVKGTESDYEIIDTVGDFGDDPGSAFAACGDSGATKDSTLVKKPGKEGNSDWTASAGTSAEDCDWVVNAQNDWSDIGQHTFVEESN